MRSRLIFWDVDTQFDFMHPAGKLYVPGAETIVSNLQSLTAFAAHHGIPIVASTDAHLETDPEFREYRPHCLVCTAGQQKIEGTLLPSRYIIPNRKIDLPRDLGSFPQLILEKQTVDVFTNPSTDSLLKLLGDREIILYGVVTEICVDRTARGLILRDYHVHLVEDAVRHLDSHRGPRHRAACPAAWRPPAHHQRCAGRRAPIRRLIGTWNSVTIESPLAERIRCCG